MLSINANKCVHFVINISKIISFFFSKCIVKKKRKIYDYKIKIKNQFSTVYSARSNYLLWDSTGYTACSTQEHDGCSLPKSQCNPPKLSSNRSIEKPAKQKKCFSYIVQTISQKNYYKPLKTTSRL